jgi:hypothetical protein
MKIKIALLIMLIMIGASMSIAVATLSDTDKTVIQLSIYTTLRGTGDFNYIDSEVAWDDSIKIWYVPKNTGSIAVAKSLGEVVGVYVGVTRSHPEMSDLVVIVGTHDTIVGKMYCPRSWVPMDEMTDDDAALLFAKVLETYKEWN